jgi:hypothetical protein
MDWSDADGSLSPGALPQPGRLDQSERRRSPQRRATQKLLRSTSSGPGSPKAGGAGAEGAAAAVTAALAAAEKEVMSPEVMKEQFNAVDQMIEEITRGLKLDSVSKKQTEGAEAQRQKEERQRQKMELAERAEGRNPQRNVTQKIEHRRDHKIEGRGIPLMSVDVVGPAGAKKVAVVDLGVLHSRMKHPSGANVRTLLELQRLRDSRERSLGRGCQGRGLAAAAKAALQPAEPALAAASGPEV